MLQEIIKYVESHGHLITFSYLPYVPAYSRDPHTKPSFTLQSDQTKYLFAYSRDPHTKPSFTLQTDQTKYLFAINDILNAIKISFNYKRVG